MLGMSLLFGGAFAAFIQSPIPPSTQQNFVRDTDGDGRMDQMEIRFLGNLTKEYVSSMLDSLTFEWIDSSGAAKHYTVAASKFLLNPANKRSLIVDLKSMQNGFRLLTALSTMEFSAAIYGSALLYLRDGSMYPVALKDAMAPAIMSAYLRNMRGKSNDSLTVLFSETVRTVPGCPALLEYKSEYPHNEGWNFVANPFMSYFDIEHLDSDAPILVSDRSSFRTLQAVSPLDDDFVLKPLQAFLIQRSSTQQQVVFHPEGRQPDFPKHQEATNNARQLRRQALRQSRVRYDATLSHQSQQGDTLLARTRLVVTPRATEGYDPGQDAPFLTMDDSLTALYTASTVCATA